MVFTAAFFGIVLLLIFWLYVIYIAWQLSGKRRSGDLLYLGLALWPMALVDSTVRISAVTDWFPIAGLFHCIPVLVAAALLHYLQKQTQPRLPQPLWLTSLLVLATIASEVPLLMNHVNMANWISATPSGQPLVLWWLYLPYLITCSCLLIIGGQLVEIGRRYQRCLPWQAVDIKRYENTAFHILASFLLLLSLAALLLIVSVASNIYTLMLWPLVIDLSISLVLIVMLWRAVLATHLLPSPLDYKRIYAAAKKLESKDTAIVAKADKAMIASKAYKTIGLTIKEFASTANVDPTTLLLALKRVKKQDFRGFIFHYRMEYARNVVMRTDASIANVAKRLGFHSEKFLSGPFLTYLEKRK